MNYTGLSDTDRNKQPVRPTVAQRQTCTHTIKRVSSCATLKTIQVNRNIEKKNTPFPIVMLKLCALGYIKGLDSRLMLQVIFRNMITREVGSLHTVRGLSEGVSAGYPFKSHKLQQTMNRKAPKMK